MKARWQQMCWLADDDPIKIEAFSRLPLVEYWAILDDKIEKLEKEYRQWQKQQHRKT